MSGSGPIKQGTIFCSQLPMDLRAEMNFQQDGLCGLNQIDAGKLAPPVIHLVLDPEHGIQESTVREFISKMNTETTCGPTCTLRNTIFR